MLMLNQKKSLIFRRKKKIKGICKTKMRKKLFLTTKIDGKKKTCNTIARCETSAEKYLIFSFLNRILDA